MRPATNFKFQISEFQIDCRVYRPVQDPAFQDRAPPRFSANNCGRANQGVWYVSLDVSIWKLGWIFGAVLNWIGIGLRRSGLQPRRKGLSEQGFNPWSWSYRG